MAKKRNATKTRNNGEEEATLGSAEEDEEKGEQEEAVKDTERLNLLGPTKLWTGLVLHHARIFLSRM